VETGAVKEHLQGGREKGYLWLWLWDRENNNEEEEEWENERSETTFGFKIEKKSIVFLVTVFGGRKWRAAGVVAAISAIEIER
jgi:hypothetical protein